ncbi:MAG: 2Fe-2S iron-sulfur cluster binding domain-containing protein, partial [Gammaproteobacteria bacterium]|nr:2Fe-2S iron-sulfur cluster binding domain-containing protein [Gammaproteobacteria bacterium]
MLDTTVILGVVMFTVTILSLTLIILYARKLLVSTGDVTIEINDDPSKTITVPAGGKLLPTLASKGVFLASACGGGGTCAQCRCRVTDGGGTILSTEEGHFTRAEIHDKWR